MFVLSASFSTRYRWRRTRWLVLFPCAAVPLLVAQGEGPAAGLLQRLLLTVVLGWMTTLAVLARAALREPQAGPAGEDEPPSRSVDVVPGRGVRG
jgi:hypothetical protein